MPELLQWSYAIAEIPETGLTARRNASLEERSSIASALGLLSCGLLEAEYEVRPLSRGRFLLQGELRAEVSQSCVVTLEPVEDCIMEPFEVEFVPDAGPASASFDPLDIREIEPLESGVIPVGRIVYEQLASAVDPYPRKKGARLEQSTSTSPGTGTGENPFSVLGKLRSKG
jgi:hypothetical protein